MIKNQLLKALAKPYKQHRSNAPPLKRILILSTTGLGDTLWATPALRAIKETYPHCELTFLTSPIGYQVIKHNPYIDTTITVSDPIFMQCAALKSMLKHINADTILSFHTSQRLILPIAAMSRAHAIIGCAGMNKGLDSLLTKALPKTHEHEITRRLRIASAIGATTSDETLTWHISDDEKLAALALKKKFNKPLFMMHPGAKDRFKQWPISHFITLGHALVKEYGAQILISGNAQEKNLADQIANRVPGAISLAGTLPLRVFAAFLPHVDCFITNDTGPMHMAFALNTPTVALFGPTDPSLCGPHQAKNCRVIAKRSTCTPCLRKKCRDPFCMSAIGIDEVFANVKRLYIEGKSLCNNH